MSTHGIVLIIGLALIALIALWLFITVLIFKIRKQRILNAREAMATALTSYYDGLSALAKAAQVFKDDQSFSDVLDWRLKQPLDLSFKKQAVFLEKMQILETSLSSIYQHDQALRETPMVQKLLDDHERAYATLCQTKRRHNAYVSSYNAMIKVIPNNIISRVLNYRLYAFFKVTVEPVLIKNETRD